VHALRAMRIAVEAETLRLRLRARRAVVQAVLGVVALVFLLGALALVHVAVWYWLCLDFGWTRQATAGLLAAADIVVALCLAIAAVRVGPGRAEAEAQLVRQQAWGTLAESTVWAILALRVLGILRQVGLPRRR
jgi:hypothetical protein